MKETVEGGPASRLMRWILKLAEYNFSVEHKPGAVHNDADGISRTVDGLPPTETDIISPQEAGREEAETSNGDPVCHLSVTGGAEEATPT